MEAAAVAAEVFSILQPIGLLGAVMVLFFLLYALWASSKAFRTGRSLRLKISPRSLEVNIGPERETCDLQLEKGEGEHRPAGTAADERKRDEDTEEGVLRHRRRVHR